MTEPFLTIAVEKIGLVARLTLATAGTPVVSYA